MLWLPCRCLKDTLCTEVGAPRHRSLSTASERNRGNGDDRMSIRSMSRCRPRAHCHDALLCAGTIRWMPLSYVVCVTGLKNNPKNHPLALSSYATNRLGVLFHIWMREFFEAVACYQSLLLSASSDTSAPSGGLEESSADSTWPALTLPHFRVGWRRVLPRGCRVAVSEPSHWDPLILQHSCHKKRRRSRTTRGEP